MPARTRTKGLIRLAGTDDTHSAFHAAPSDASVPGPEPDPVVFTDLFDVEEIQAIQDAFSSATGVAALITAPDGTPITRPSNFCRLCSDIIRGSEAGLANCQHSDAEIGNANLEGPTIRPCLSGGLWDAGASITAGGQHVANWLIGQVRNEAQDDATLLSYADEIGVDRETFAAALAEVPIMSQESFELIAQMLFLFANELSVVALQNLELKRLLGESERSHEAIRENRALLAAILDAVPQAIFLKNADSVYLGCNEKFAEVAGLSRSEDVLGKSDYELSFTDDDAELYRLDDRRVIESGVAKSHIIEQVRRPDGRVIWVDTTKIPLSNGDAPPHAVLGVFEDITDRKRTEDALAASAERNRAIVQAALDGFVLTDIAGRVLEVNDAYCEMTGYTAEEFGAMSISDLEAFESPAEIAERTARLIDTGSDRFETRHRRKDGSSLPVEVSVRFLPAEGGRFAAFVRDMSRQKESERALRESQNRLQAIMNYTPALIYVKDLSGRFVLANREFEVLFGLQPGEAIGRSTADIVGDEIGAAHWANDLKVIESGESITEEEANDEADGRHTYLSVKFPLFDSAGGVQAVCGISIDVTKQKAIEQELQERTRFIEAILENAPIGFGVNAISDGRAVLISSNFERIYGIEPGGVAGTEDFFEQVYRDPEVRERMRERIMTDIATGDPSRMRWEDIPLHAAGEPPRYVTAINIPVFDQNLMISTVQDVTDRVLAEQALRESEASLNRAQHYTHVGSWTWDIKTDHLEWSDEMYRLFGLTRETFTGYLPDVIAAAIHPDDRAKVEASNAAASENGVATPLEYRVVWPDGTVHTVRGEAGEMLLDASGALEKLSGTVRDITEEKALRNAIEQQAARISKTLTSVIDIASTIVETRDPYTAGHQRRVAEIATRVAESLGFPEHVVNDIRLASLIHDVGKIQIPSELLVKPGKLSNLEYQLLKEHAAAGYRIVQAAHMEKSIADMVHQHHERCDGSGYPQGLVADQILPAAKIIAVADVMEAMMSDRPYRPAVGLEAALSEIERGAGRLYDTKAAMACVALFRTGDFVLK